MLMIRIVLLAAVMVPPLAVVAQERETQFAFTHVTVIDCTGAPAKPDMTVIITGDRISLIGKADEVTVPESARAIDCSGNFMIPGLWDMHFHGRPWDRSFCLASGVTGRRSMWGFPRDLEERDKEGEMGPPYDGVLVDRDGQERKKSGITLKDSPGLPFLRSNVSSPLIDGLATRRYYAGSIVVRDVQQAQRTVRDLKQQGFDSLKVYSSLSRDVYLAIAKEAKQQGISFAGHVPMAVSAAEASDVGQASIEHLLGIYFACSCEETKLRDQRAKRDLPYNEGRRIARDSFDEKKADALFDRFVRNGTWHVPTLIVLKWRAYANRMDFTHDPRLCLVPRDFVSLWQAKAKRMEASPRTDFPSLQRDFMQDLQVVGQMHKAGVRIMAGTDFFNPFCLPGFGLHDELALLVEAGLSPMESLQAATRSPAEYLGRLKDLGTIEQGKLADLVLLDANPLHDINNVRNIESVVFAGHYFSRKQLDKILAVHELEHSILELAESFSEERLEQLGHNQSITHVIRLRIQDAVVARSGFRKRRHLGSKTGQDVTLLFPRMSHLRELFLNNTKFNDVGASRLTSLDKLETLQLGSTRITDAGLKQLGKLTQLTRLDFADTQVTDAGIVHLRGCNRLEGLMLDRTSIGDEGMQVLSQMPHLQQLGLSGTSVTDAGLMHLTKLPKLTTLRLANTDVTDEGLESIQQIKSLTSLDLTNTTVSREGVASLNQALPGCLVSVSKSPQLTVNLVYPTRDAFVRTGESVLLKAKTRATIGAEVLRVEFLDNGNLVATKNEPPYEVPWQGESTGRHEIRVRVFDESGKQTSTQQNSLFVGIHGMRRTIEFSEDDVEEQENGSIYLDSSDLELVRNSSGSDQVIGIRLRDITIPKHARITKAYLQFTCNEPSQENTELSIRAELSPDASAFEKLKNNVSSRSVTELAVKWSPKPWTKPNERTENQRTPDLAGLIQEVISQQGWENGSSVVFVITGTGQRNAMSSDGQGASPILHVEYEL